MTFFRPTLVVIVMTFFLVMPLQIVDVYSQGQTIIKGVGATFPYPLIDTWRLEYEKLNPNLNVDYQAIGSGGGVQKLIDKTIDFGASDAPLTPQEILEAEKPVVHIPETIGSVAIVYNIPTISGVATNLNLSGQILADIYLGNIKMWNDKNITDLNPGIDLPDEPINVIHRADSSGTTFVFTDYLSSTNSQWKNQIGKSKSVTWPIGSSADRNEGVSNLVSGTENSIGYVELAYSVAAGHKHVTTFDSTHRKVPRYF